MRPMGAAPSQTLGQLLGVAEEQSGVGPPGWGQHPAGLGQVGGAPAGPSQSSLAWQTQPGSPDRPFVGELCYGSVDRGLPQVPHGGSR